MTQGIFFARTVGMQKAKSSRDFSLVNNFIS